LAKRFDYRFRIYQDEEELDINSSKITYVTEKVNDDIGPVLTFIKVPASSIYTIYDRELRADALFTYFKDLDNDIDNGVNIKLNGGVTEYPLRPDLWTEKIITSLSAKNDSSTDRVILIVQAYPRVVSFY